MDLRNNILVNRDANLKHKIWVAACFILLFLMAASFAQKSYGLSFVSSKSGNWNDPCTWNNANGCPGNPPAAVVGVNVPGPNDDVIIFNKHIIDVTVASAVRNLTIDNGTGNNTTTVNIKGNITFTIHGKLVIDRHGNIIVDGAFVYVKGDICVKNNGNIAVQGTPPTVDSYFFVESCSSSGSTDCSTIDSNPPTFIQGAYMIWCIACKGNPSATFEGTPGACMSFLPLEFFDFAATYNKDHPKGPAVQLSFVTVGGKIGHTYTLERSRDGHQFEPITTIQAKASNEGYTSYAYVDYNPLPDFSYYRLKQVTEGEKPDYSKIIAVYVPAEDIGLFTLFPNPCSGRDLTIYFVRCNALWIEISDAYGNRIDQSRYTLSASTAQARLHFLQPLPKGLYYLKLGLDEKRVQSKFIVH